MFRDGEDLDSQGEGSSQPDTISLASRTSQNTLDSDKVRTHTHTTYARVMMRCDVSSHGGCSCTIARALICSSTASFTHAVFLRRISCMCEWEQGSIYREIRTEDLKWMHH